MSENETHERRGDLSLDEDLYEAMVAERKAWEAEHADDHWGLGDGPPKPDRQW